jgi:uncharacterized membrane protein
MTLQDSSNNYHAYNAATAQVANNFSKFRKSVNSLLNNVAKDVAKNMIADYKIKAGQQIDYKHSHINELFLDSHGF